MSAPVDPKIKQALRKKPAERTPEVRGGGCNSLPAVSFYFYVNFPLVRIPILTGFLLGAGV